MPVNEEKLYALSGRQGRCRFCGKQFNFKGQIKSHRCTLRLACRRQYQEAVARNSDIKLLYPQWSTYDVAAQNNSFPNGQNPTLTILVCLKVVFRLTRQQQMELGVTLFNSLAASYKWNLPLLIQQSKSRSQQQWMYHLTVWLLSPEMGTNPDNSSK